MSEVFQGETSVDGRGCWMNPETKLNECDQVTVIESAHNCADKVRIRQVLDLVGKEGGTHQQNTVAVAGTNRFYVLPPHRLRAGAKEPVLEGRLIPQSPPVVKAR